MKAKEKVYIKKNDYIKYPKTPPYNPDKYYPEYPFNREVGEENKVYDLIRDLLFEMELDKENFGASVWNPFKQFIKPGDMVVLKPNMVMHRHGFKNYSIDSVITHGSIIRAILDYVYIALEGKGKIVIGDASLQRCDFNQVIKKNGLKKIIEFYRSKKEFKIELVDFRKERAICKNKKIIGTEELEGDPRGYTVVDLGKYSALNEISDDYEKFRVTNYDPDLMTKHHNKEKHEYLIPNSILQADAVINLPKPKSHRKAGITAAMKNLVGINGHKDWLPHHRICSKDEGGDEYLNKNIFKKIHVYLQRQIDLAGMRGNIVKSNIIRFIRKLNSVFRKLTEKNEYMEGSWWGNDTIWRTVCDLNRILMYADENGKIKNNVQRKYFNLLDMIISGEKEGPLEPTPKETGILIAGFNPLFIDTVVATIMGFDFRKIPNIYKAYELNSYPLTSYDYSDIDIITNETNWNKQIDDISLKETLQFKPTKGWEGHIEMGGRGKIE